MCKIRREYRDKHKAERGTAIVIIQSADRILLVKEPTQADPICWKFPGGGVKRWKKETYKEAAKRELEEETGLILDIRQLKMLGYRVMLGHLLVIFGANVCSFDGLLSQGSSGEITRTCTLKEIYKLSDFLPNHQKFLRFWENGQLNLSFFE